MKDGTIIKIDLDRVYNYPIYPRDSKIMTNKGFNNIDNGAEGGTGWTFVRIKDKKSFYFDRFSGHPDKFPPNHLPKPINLSKS